MIRTKWNQLDGRVRRLILVGAAAEGLLKLAALNDLRRRPSRDVRGSRALWAAAITLINSGGLVPIVYFRRGRRAQS